MCSESFTESLILTNLVLALGCKPVPVRVVTGQVEVSQVLLAIVTVVFEDLDCFVVRLVAGAGVGRAWPVQGRRRGFRR